MVPFSHIKLKEENTALIPTTIVLMILVLKKIKSGGIKNQDGLKTKKKKAPDKTIFHYPVFVFPIY